MEGDDSQVSHLLEWEVRDKLGKEARIIHMGNN